MKIHTLLVLSFRGSGKCSIVVRCSIFASQTLQNSLQNYTSNNISYDLYWFYNKCSTPKCITLIRRMNSCFTLDRHWNEKSIYKYKNRILDRNNERNIVTTVYIICRFKSNFSQQFPPPCIISCITILMIVTVIDVTREFPLVSSQWLFFAAGLYISKTYLVYFSYIEKGFLYV